MGCAEVGLHNTVPDDRATRRSHGAFGSHVKPTFLVSCAPLQMQYPCPCLQCLKLEPGPQCNFQTIATSVVSRRQLELLLYTDLHKMEVSNN